MKLLYKILPILFISFLITSCVEEKPLPFEYDWGSFGVIIFERGPYTQPLQVVFTDDKTVKIESKLQITDFYRYQLNGNKVSVEPQNGTNAKVNKLEIEFIDQKTIRLYCDVKFNYDLMGGSDGPSYIVNGDTYTLND